MLERTTDLTLEDLRFNPPEFDQRTLLEFARREFGASGALTPLDGERDQNHLLTTPEGEACVLKVAGPDEDASVVDFQVEALLHVERVAPDIPVPRVRRTSSGGCIARLTSEDGRVHLVRLLSYLPGVPFWDEPEPTPAVLRRIGEFQGDLCRALADFHHPAARHFMPWDISNGLVLNDSLARSARGDVERLVVPLLGRFEAEVLPAMNGLRRQVIHNDGHKGNLLKSAPGAEDFVGAIDFGDMIHAPLIQDLAVSLDSFMSDAERRVEAGAALIAGFHRRNPLTGEELGLIYDLCLLRGALSIQLYDFSIRNDAPNKAMLEEEYAGLVRGFVRILEIDRERAVKRWREACAEVGGSA